MKSYVFTHNPPAKTPKGVEFVNEDINEFAKRLRATPGKDIWMMVVAELSLRSWRRVSWMN
jgi:dihydrofolate reductase